MAITIIQDRVNSQLHKYTFIANPIPYLVSSNMSNRKNFKFIFNTYIDHPNIIPTSSYLVNTNKIYKEPVNGYGFFNPQDILSNRLSYDLNYNTITFALRPNSIKNFNIGIGEEYSRELKFTSVQNISGKLVLNFNTLHNLRVGDAIVILSDDPSQFNSNTIVLVDNINSSTSVITNISWNSSYANMAGFIIEGEQFYDNYYSFIDNKAYVGFIFPNYGSQPRPTRFKEGDLVTIRQFPGAQYPQYNRSATILKVDTVTVSGNNYDRVVTNIPWAGTTPVNGGIIFSRNNYYFEDLVYTNTSNWTFVLNGALEYNSYPNFNYATYINNKFLTNSPRKLKIQPGQYHTLALLNGLLINTDKIEKLEIRLYDHSDNIINTLNIVNPYEDSNNRLHQSLSVGVGTQNIDDYLTNNMQFPISWDNVKYYKVRLVDSNTIRSEEFTFELDCPSKYKTHRVMFLNRLGEFDYFNFKQGYNKKQTSELSTFKRKPGSIISNNWNYSIEERGVTTFNSDVKETLILRSYWINKEESIWLKELLSSKEIYVFDDENRPIPINIITNNIEEKVDIQQPLFRLELEFAYSNKNIYN